VRLPSASGRNAHLPEFPRGFVGIKSWFVL
jgi:hypothetical protein